MLLQRPLNDVAPRLISMCVTIFKRENLDSNKSRSLDTITTMIQAYADVSPAQLGKLLDCADIDNTHEALMSVIGLLTLNELEKCASHLMEPYQLGKAKGASGGSMYKLIGLLASITRPSERRAARIWNEVSVLFLSIFH
jgi:hypothetical protein